MSTTASTGLYGPAFAEPQLPESSLSPANRLRASLIGLALGIALAALAAIAGLLFTAAVFNYSVGELI